MTAPRYYQLAASISLIALIFLCLAWEGALAPLRPGGSWLILKGVFPLVALFGILRGKRYTYKWVSLFVQFYLMEGLVRATSDHGMSQWLAMGETVLASILFVTTILYIRATRPAQEEKAAQQN
ncbi:MAG: putative transrane protein [Proteobacteria bacterium]|nr:putative transrane protein [Pseudomonadota bacterium]